MIVVADTENNALRLINGTATRTATRTTTHIATHVATANRLSATISK